ncbi:hypothetical protein UFOVP724_150 [uncultured Caudovirales phage]|uniref:Uncharacterized protein n=1 Tax=uncultured Caudovirales phage TaxID=2100421 RepID=A0A6J5NN53_9CAUD|nr:hypothetical protein UFOVP724_150 [uncultured Caudovirales phage]
MQLVFQLNEATQPTITTLDFQIFCNSPIDKIQYKNLLTSKDVKIAYFESKELNPFDNLEIVDTSWTLSSNNLDNITGHYFANTMQIASDYNELLFTDVVNHQNNEVTPLWYVHQPKKITEVISFERLSSANLIKNELSQGYKILNGKLYTNYQNVYDYKNDSFDIFLVNGKDSSGKFYTELLNLKPAIKKMEWNDINPLNGELINSVYSQEQLPNGKYNYYINFSEGFTERMCSNGLNGYYYKVAENNKIELLRPDALTGQEPWNVRVRYATQVNANNGRQYLYTIPEYNKQPYNPFSPLILVAEKLCFKVTDNIIKLSPSTLTYAPELNINIDVLVFDYEENLKKAYTSDASKHGTRVYNSNVLFEYGFIESVDEKNGFISFTNSLSFSNEDIVKATYFYYAEDYIMLDLNVNPAYNKNANNKFVVYVKPIDITDSLIYNSNVKSVFYLIVDENNQIIYSNENIQETDFQVFKTDYSCEFNGNYLILGEIHYKDHSNIDDCFSFDIRTKNKFVKNDSFKENYRLLQSKFGYNERGQNIDRLNCRFLACSPETYALDSNTFLSQFNQGSLAQNILFKNNPDLNFSLDYFYSSTKLVFKWKYQGPGQYLLSCKFSKNKRTIDFNSSSKRYQKTHRYFYYYLVDDFVFNRDLDGNEIEWTLTYIPDNNSSYRESYSERLIINI